MSTEVTKKRDPREWCFAKRYYQHITIKQWRFCMYYVGEANFDATQAILMSYGNYKPYGADDERIPTEERNTIKYAVAKAMATQNLAKVPLQECISDLLQVTVMPKEEVLNRISKIARANIDDLIDIDQAGKPILNLKRAKERGALCLIKTINFGSDGQVKEVKLHDAFMGLIKMGQHHKLFDRQAETPTDPKDLARELLEELRFKHEGVPDNVLVEKVVARFSAQGVTEHDLIQEAPGSEAVS